MANPTSNFNWQMPTASDLVTDLPADFEVFGQAVDTSLADLKGGTTGQVLSKTSGTDMDFTWVTTDDTNAIQNAIVDAKGDLIAASAADTPARLAVGNNGETLVADSSTSTGLRYQSAKTTNGLYNSSFQVWQRGTTNVTTANAYTADRWQKGGGTHYGVSRQVTGDTTNLPFIQYCARVQRTNGSATVSGIDLAQTLETLDAINYAGKTVTISFYARAGADFSSASNALTALVYSGTGTDQSIAGGFTGIATAFTSTNTLTTTWQRFQATGTISAAATEIAFYTNYTPVGTAGADDYYEITGCQIEYGSVASSYTSMTGTIQGELAACQRYFWRDTGFQSSGGVQSANDNNVWFSLQNFNGVPMRTTPTAAIESTPYIADFQANLRDITSVNCNNKYAVGFAYSSTKLTSNLAFGLNFSDAGRALSFSSEL
jgi:hypothetical protein